MDIFLVRHGEAAASWGESPDPGLSDLGWEQAESAADTLQAKIDGNTQFISSPLQRAQETAEPLAKRLDAKVVLESVFREVPSPVPLAERPGWLREFMRQQWQEQGSDLINWRDTAYATLQNYQVPTVVFTHFLVINAVVSVIEDFPGTLRFWPDNGSITHLRRNGRELELVQLGADMKTRVN